MEQTINAEVLQEVEVVDIMDLRPTVQFNNETSKFVTNVAEMKEALKTGLEWYDYEVTEATLSDAKADITKLNGLEKAIAEQRKKYGTKFDTWKSVNNAISELEKMIKATSGKLKRGVDYFETLAEEEKKAKIKAYWDEKRSGIDYELVHNPKLKNKGETEDKLKKELDEKYEKIQADKESIKFALDQTDLTETERQMVWMIYNKSIDQAQTIAKVREIQEAKAKAKAIEEQKRFEAEKQKEVQQYQEEHPEATLSEVENMVSEEPIWTLTLQMVGTKENFQSFLAQTNFMQAAEQCEIVIKKKEWSK